VADRGQYSCMVEGQQGCCGWIGVREAKLLLKGPEYLELTLELTFIKSHYTHFEFCIVNLIIAASNT